MHKKDLRKADGFPADIDRDKLVVVIIFRNHLNRIFYFNKNGTLCSDFLPPLPKFAEGIYILK